MSEQTLKPCPWCNEKMQILDDEECSIIKYYAHCMFCWFDTGYFNSKENLIQYINQRPQEDALNQRIKELKAWQKEAVFKLRFFNDNLETIYTILAFDYDTELKQITNLIKLAEKHE